MPAYDIRYFDEVGFLAYRLDAECRNDVTAKVTGHALKSPSHKGFQVWREGYLVYSRPAGQLGVHNGDAPHSRVVNAMQIGLGHLREQLMSLLLTIQLLILFVMPAARATGMPLPHIVIDGVLFLPVMLVLVLARSRGAMATVILSVALTIAGSVWRQERPDLVADTVSAAGQVLPQLALLWVVSTAVFGGGHTTYHRILGAIAMYLGIGMIFTSLDILLVQFVPDAFTHLPANSFELRQALTYFSFSTLTTSSFGDILPTHTIARSLANFEAICGQLFPAILLARVVGLHSSTRQAPDRG
jgi:hypothetical protein